MKKLILSLIIGVFMALSSYAEEPETWLYNKMPYAQTPDDKITQREKVCNF